ncbi:cyclic nucleotide gated channel beta 1 [Sparganum proliferum]
MQSRLRELRSRFSSRAEEIRRQVLAPKKTSSEHELDSEEEVSTTIALTATFELNIDDPGGKGDTYGLWHHPARSLHVRRPDCLLDVSPQKRPFVKTADKRLAYIAIDDGGDIGADKSAAETVEIIGQEFSVPTTWRIPLPQWLPTPKEILTATLAPGSVLCLVWMFLVFLSFIYNAVTIPLREAFDTFDTKDHMHLWLVMDCSADVIYVLDVLVFKPRLHFIDGGIVKFPILVEFFDRTDQRVNVGFAVRLAKTLIYMIYIIHVECCGYYAFNRIQGLNATSWSIGQHKNNPYIYSFYVATKMATSIGNLPHATNPPEFLFMTTYWLTGVYVSAILIGQVIDILDNERADREAYKKLMNNTLSYMKQLRAPEADVDKVRTWFMFNWNQQKTLDENLLIETLPFKLKTDLLINVHFQTLSKDCERTMISDLICKLKPVLFLPGAIICQKGEVGLEMYIVKHGFVEVVGGPDNSLVFVTLKEGSVFGEISLLAFSGKNRRTATVRSKGYSTLFRLTKKDFEEAMKNYPAAYKLLVRRAHKMLNKDKKKAAEAAHKEEQAAAAAGKKDGKGVGSNAAEDSDDEDNKAIEVIKEHAYQADMKTVADEVIRKKSMYRRFPKPTRRPKSTHSLSIPEARSTDSSHHSENVQTANKVDISPLNSETLNEDISSLPDEADNTLSSDALC